VKTLTAKILRTTCRCCAREEWNGRQIRNAITTARLLANYQNRPMCYDHLEHVISVSGQFEQDMKDLRGGQTDEERKKLEELHFHLTG
jgi:hypothetical protein